MRLDEAASRRLSEVHVGHQLAPYDLSEALIELQTCLTSFGEGALIFPALQFAPLSFEEVDCLGALLAGGLGTVLTSERC